MRLRKVIRATIVTLLLMIAAVPLTLYIVLSTDWAQHKICDVAEVQLTNLLGTPLTIDKVNYRPFNTIEITGIKLSDPSGKATAPAEIGRVAARFELWHFMRTGRLMFDYALIDAPLVHLSRANQSSPLNIQPIIDRLKKPDSGQESNIDLRINTIIIRNGLLVYDVESEPATPQHFNPSHIRIDDLNLHAYIRHIKGNKFDIALESLNFTEASGLKVKDLAIDIAATPELIDLRTFALELPESHISLEPVKLAINGYDQIAAALDSASVRIATNRAAVISSADLCWVSSTIGELDRTITMEFNIEANRHKASVDNLFLYDSRGTKLKLSGKVNNLDSIQDVEGEVEIANLELPGTATADLIRRFNGTAANYVARSGGLRLKGHLSGDMHSAKADLRGEIANGTVNIEAEAKTKDRYKTVALTGNVSVDKVKIGTIAGIDDLGSVTTAIEGSATVGKGLLDCQGDIDISAIAWKGHEYRDIDISVLHNGNATRIEATSPDEYADFRLTAAVDAISASKSLEMYLDIKNLCPSALNLSVDKRAMSLRGRLSADLAGTGIDDIAGKIALSNLRLKDAEGDTLNLRRFTVTAVRDDKPEQFIVTSDWLNGVIEGTINPSTLPDIVKELASTIVPSLLNTNQHLRQRLTTEKAHNEFIVDLTLSNATRLSEFFHLPVKLFYPVDINAHISSTRGEASFVIDAPYLQQGDKIIDATVVSGILSSADSTASVYATTHMPTKKGPMALVLGVNGAKSRFDTKIDWQIERKIPINGRIEFSTLLNRSPLGGVCATTHFNPGSITFGDDVWAINPSDIDWCDGTLTFDDFALTAGKQHIAIDGRASAEAEDSLTVDLTDIHLISIFETLEIENALIGGTATGTFTARQALSRMPILSTECLHVDSISYNYCTIGDADIKARWDNDRMSFFLDADIVNPEGQHSYISGDIFPTTESLDLDFRADNVKVGFMQPFMAAFASDVKGFVSGHARLFGTFHDIDMEGDVFVRDLSLRIDFTNTTYTTTDSVHIRPGRIELHDITLHDIYGKTARLDGVLTHDYFHSPCFDFQVSDAKDFLSYNVTSKINPDWYGTIFGNGGATVSGKPGLINIGVNMATAPGSTFTFVLSDRLDAEQYSFITFNDVTQYSSEEILMTTDDTPEAVKEFQRRINAKSADRPSNYVMSIRVVITPDAQLNIVMDPVGGDRIRAYGEGDLRLTYDADENDLRMYGTYELERGSYNFTLQDIIIKDFTIEPGSTITFRGDPYSAQLALEAVYQVNANLSDLDESFTQDKDLNRTNVPVQALLKVSGDMRQPDLAFDLRFPTLTSDTYRKVRSIISTDDMMNRQIIYLLALNRFYTPDYMASTTKGSELFSVASSTISSQLSSMLGKLSENWSIAPNLRSDRGDFSDVEVDVALSSRLLNNRLLFNGNFGYRDKSLNTNQFIGDFDLEYLLNPRGNWRLKAYNRYNDQNYYVRTATTTQGIGIMFRRDFDSMFGWLHHKHKKPATEQPAESPDITKISETADSISAPGQP